MKIRSLVLAAAIASSLATTAAAQVIGPTDAGTGIKRGIEEQNNSGEVGEVTLFPRGQSTRVLIQLHGEAPGRSQPAHIHRGTDCDVASPQPAYALKPVVNGSSSTIVNLPSARLLSGNYVVIVHAASASANMSHMHGKHAMAMNQPVNEDRAHYLSCGRLYSGE